MPTVVFMIYHGTSHFNACFRMARLLSDSYKVVFAGHPHFHSHIRNQGFDFYPLVSLPIARGFEKWVNQQAKKKNLFFHILRDRHRHRLFFVREEELGRMMADLSPDVVLVDSHLRTDFLVLYPTLKEQRCRMAFVQTTIPDQAHRFFPPVNSFLCPGDPGVAWDVRLARWKKIGLRAWDWFRYVGADETSLWSWVTKRNKVPGCYIGEGFVYPGPFIQRVDELVLMPVEFDFPGRPIEPWQQYIGFHIDPLRKEIAAPGFYDTLKVILEERPTRKIIYCSLGTVKSDVGDKVSQFIRKLIAAVEGLSVNLVISLRAGYDVGIAGLPRVHFFKNVPQYEMLAHTDLFINHGGINSVREAIDRGVPMLVYPVEMKVDQAGTGARVKAHGLGLMGKMEKDTPAAIRDKIIALLSNNQYVTNLHRLRHIDRSYGEEAFFKAFHQIAEVQ